MSLVRKKGLPFWGFCFFLFNRVIVSFCRVCLRTQTHAHTDQLHHAHRLRGWFALRRLRRWGGGNARPALEVHARKHPVANHHSPLSESDRCGLVVDIWRCAVQEALWLLAINCALAFARRPQLRARFLEPSPPELRARLPEPSPPGPSPPGLRARFPEPSLPEVRAG